MFALSRMLRQLRAMQRMFDHCRNDADDSVHTPIPVAFPQLCFVGPLYPSVGGAFVRESERGEVSHVTGEKDVLLVGFVCLTGCIDDVFGLGKSRLNTR